MSAAARTSGARPAGATGSGTRATPPVPPTTPTSPTATAMTGNVASKVRSGRPPGASEGGPSKPGPGRRQCRPARSRRPAGTCAPAPQGSRPTPGTASLRLPGVGDEAGRHTPRVGRSEGGLGRRPVERPHAPLALHRPRHATLPTPRRRGGRPPPDGPGRAPPVPHRERPRGNGRRVAFVSRSQLPTPSRSAPCRGGERPRAGGGPGRRRRPPLRARRPVRRKGKRTGRNPLTLISEDTPSLRKEGGQPPARLHIAGPSSRRRRASTDREETFQHHGTISTALVCEDVGST